MPRVLYTLEANADVPDLGVKAGDVLFVREGDSVALAREMAGTAMYVLLCQAVALGRITLADPDEFPSDVQGAAPPAQRSPAPPLRLVVVRPIGRTDGQS